MFKDSDIAKNAIRKRQSCIRFDNRVTPYCNRKLTCMLNTSPFVVGFGESLNKIRRISRWAVVTRYFTSCFHGRSRAVNLRTAFDTATSALQKEKILQMSMDGPNVNWFFSNGP